MSPALFALLFNEMSIKDKQRIASMEIWKAMTDAGYRLVFDRWYRQEKPTTQPLG